MGGANGFDEFRWRSCLEQAPVDSVLQGPSDELLLERVNEDQGFRLGTPGEDLMQYFKPTHLGHPDIQQQDMRLECSHPTQHLAAIRCCADDLNVFLLRQEPAEPLPQKRMSVSDEYRDRVH